MCSISFPDHMRTRLTWTPSTPVAVFFQYRQPGRLDLAHFVAVRELLQPVLRRLAKELDLLLASAAQRRYLPV